MEYGINKRHLGTKMKVAPRRNQKLDDQEEYHVEQLQIIGETENQNYRNGLFFRIFKLFSKLCFSSFRTHIGSAVEVSQVLSNKESLLETSIENPKESLF